MRSPRLTCLCAAAAALIAVASTASSARADGAPPAPAANARADALFQEGKKLLEQGSFGPACERLALSDTLDPTISTLGLLAACHEQQGRTATAWREYRATEKRAEAAGDTRAEFARQRAAALEPLLARLVIRVEHPSPEIEVLRNLESLPVDKLGSDVIVDPGAYEILVRAPKKAPYRVTVTVKEGARADVVIPELAAEGSVSPASKIESGALLVAPAPMAKPAVAGEAGPASNPRLPGALVAGGIGLVGVGLGVAFGFVALDRNRQSTTLHALCQPPGAPPNADACDKGATLRDGAFTAATASTVSFGIGAAGLVTGAVLLLLPSAKSPAITLAPTAGGAIVSGRF